MAVNYAIDEDDILKKMVMMVMKKHEQFRVLTNLRFLFVWRLGDPEYDKESMPIVAMVRKLPTRERDLYKKDIELRVFLDAWQKMSEKQKFRTIFRSLLSIHLELDESMSIQADEDGRLIFRIIPPDVLIRVFKEELELFGLPDENKHSLEILELYKSKKERLIA